MHRLVILDNYDSFAYNIYQLLGELTGTAATDCA
jgi:anthranilate/para-aminobenzoate synthase component II